MLRKGIICLISTLLCGLNLANAEVELGYLFLGDNGDFSLNLHLEFAEKYVQD